MQSSETRAGRLVKRRKTQVAEKATSVSSKDHLEPIILAEKYDEFSLKKLNGQAKKKKAAKKDTEQNYKSCYMNVCCKGTECPANLRYMSVDAQPSVTGETEVIAVHDVRFGTVIPPNRSPTLLLAVFSERDHTCDIILRAGRKLGFEVTYCDSYDTAIEAFQGKSHDLIIVDARSSKVDYDTLCRLEDTHKMPCSLEAFQCIAETLNILVWVNELNQLKYSDIRPLAQYSTIQVLFAAIDKCNECIIITDQLCRIQYINPSGTNFFGFRHEEILGKTLQSRLAHDPEQIDIMCSRLLRGRTWQHGLLFNRKTQAEPVNIACTAVPVNCAGRAPTHFALVMNTSDLTVHSGKKVPSDASIPMSTDRSYTSIPRSSIARISNLPIETPITKVVNLIIQAQDKAGTNVQVVKELDKVVDLLRRAELYTPQMKDDFLQDDRVAADLISALISHSVKMSTDVALLLEESLEWNFDMLHLEQLTNNTPLLHMGFNLMIRYNVCSELDCDEGVMYNYLLLVESKYRRANVYHNSTHAADVMQAVAAYMQRDRLKSILDPLDQAGSLIAAACHDLDHPGRSTGFLTNSDNPLAILYNDVAVLEMHHSALAFQLALGDNRVNIFKNLERGTYKSLRQTIIDMILATEMTKHFEHLSKFVSACTPCNEIEDPMTDYVQMSQLENLILIKRMMIKCADVSNPTRPLHLCVEWSRRITEEYCQQTDEEISKELPVLMPMFERSTCSVPKSQIGFFDFIINDMIEAWNAFIDFPEMVTQLRQNYMKWRQFEEKGYTTLEDIERLQSQLFPPGVPISD